MGQSCSGVCGIQDNMRGTWQWKARGLVLCSICECAYEVDNAENYTCPCCHALCRTNTRS